jgi:hypothetical protein
MPNFYEIHPWSLKKKENIKLVKEERGNKEKKRHRNQNFKKKKKTRKKLNSKKLERKIFLK